MTGRRAWAVSAAIAVLAAGCGEVGPGVSLDEAREIAESFRQGLIAPPPRRVTDLIHVIETHPKSSPEASRAIRAEADRPAPASAGEADLAWFLDKRARAAQRIGRSRQARNDWRDALRYGKRSLYETDWSRFQLRLALEEVATGHYTRGVTLLQELLDGYADKSLTGRLISWYSLLAEFKALAGRPEEAWEALDLAKRWHAKAISHGDYGIWRRTYVMALATAEAVLLDAEGRHVEAEGELLRAVGQVEEGYWGAPQAAAEEGLRRRRALTRYALNLMLQGRLPEAELKAREVVRLALDKYGQYWARFAETLPPLARILFAQGRFDDADAVARKAIHVYRQIDTEETSLALALARSIRADVLTAQGRWTEAVDEYAAIARAMADDPESFDRYLGRNLNWALALLKLERTGEARPIIDKALRFRRDLLGDDHFQVAECRALSGMADLIDGDAAKALAAFSAAMPVLLAHRQEMQIEGVEGGGLEERRLRVFIETYLGVLAAVAGTALERQAGTDAAHVAFEVADAGRALAVQTAIAESAARASVRDPELERLVRLHQDTGLQIRAAIALMTELFAQPSEDRDKAVLAGLRSKVASLKAARRALFTEIEGRFPRYTELIRPSPATIPVARRSLRAGETLISTFVGQERAFVWAVPADGPVAFAAVPMGRADVSRRVRALRAALEPNAATLADIPPFDVAGAHQLYTAFLAPVADTWRPGTDLVVVADGPLGTIPLALLPTAPGGPPRDRDLLFDGYRGVPWLARTHAVTVVPSVAALSALRSGPGSTEGRLPFAGFGDPYFSEDQAREGERGDGTEATAVADAASRGRPFRLRNATATRDVDDADLSLLPRLPDTRDEIAAIAEALGADPDRDLFLGRAANEQRVKTAPLQDYRIVAFATHGLVPGDLNGLTQPALALSSPKVAGVPGDGLLTLAEILGLELNADWVVLSACNTGAAEEAGAEAVSGLGRAFFYAGTRALLVSGWPVHSAATTALTTDMFRRQAADPALTRAQALRQAMMGLVDGPGHADAAGRRVFSYAHPIFWAPFSVVGDGGRSDPSPARN